MSYFRLIAYTLHSITTPSVGIIYYIHSFIISNHFILVRDMQIWSLCQEHWEYTLDEMP